MKNPLKYVLLLMISLVFVLQSCEKKNSKTSHFDTADSIKESFQFTEIGRKEISVIKFPDYWNTQTYSDSEAAPMTKEAVYFEEKLNNLDYFDSVKGRMIKTQFYNNFLTEKNQKIDSLFVLDSISNKNISFVYIKSYKTEKGEYDWPPTFQEIDLLIFSNSKFKNKVNIYSSQNYPFAVGLRLGYLNHEGDLSVKEFDTDEEKTAFVKEEHIKIFKDGSTKTIYSIEKK